ncbi:hypothetical protein BDZ94DRAFT_1306923 [Collybia nuda]|uniref:Uncharacterized protein n=1 Tax=Collybia nuda TaxID=64659 RepID=A0A9P5YCX6_9AGAR|nr:hypothetical protein BDZ94DRAFT_1306923 [Collybia nuda]
MVNNEEKKEEVELSESTKALPLYRVYLIIPGQEITIHRMRCQSNRRLREKSENRRLKGEKAKVGTRKFVL